MTILDRVLRTIYKVPCWGACQGYGTMLMLEFGEPHLAIREPFVPRASASRKLLRLYSRRLVTVAGDWRLTIFGCHWVIRSKRDELADSNSRRPRIAKGLALLSGQALVGVSGTAASGKWRFAFDLGGSIEVRPLGDRSVEEWWLSQRSGHTFSVRGDGRFRYTPAGTPIGKAKWHRFKQERIGANGAKSNRARGK